MTKYYKVMNDDETHNGLCYHNGLNSDIWEFQHYGGHGLYYAKEIVTHHGGDIWFKSTPEQTTFTIALPKINQEELQK